ncbi:hypothetical protein [Embleya hyalina]|uniref:Uncharacterized protein n=1 Tax=Embleya hyalina TaxID=516124 RepID=A0A401YX94_9ACTN|nr:hypothetical protein [Embleya hyalina]GCD99180.1 hypothetical protein EHYA_06893 [Embleya hyalina]
MDSATHTARNIEITAKSLQEELARLAIQKQALERELAAVVAHLGSVQRAVGALEALMTETVVSAVAETDTTGAKSPAAEAPKPDTPSSIDPAAVSGTDDDNPKNYGKLTEQIMEYFSAVSDVDVRARDVAAALGRDTDSGSINAVRSTLDRLVGTSRVQRTGRGLYRARKP